MTSTTLPPLETLRTQSPAFAAQKVAKVVFTSLAPGQIVLRHLHAVREVAVRAPDDLYART